MRSEIIRPYIERLIGQWLEEPVAAPDEDGRYHSERFGPDALVASIQTLSAAGTP